MRTTSQNRQSRLLTYLNIAQILRERIEEGKYCATEFLPAERDLMVELSVSRQTIRQAIDVLKQEGIVVPEQGRGTRVVGSNNLTSIQNTTQFHLAALIIYGISRESSAEICQGCASVMRSANYHLIIAETMFQQQQRAADEATHLTELLEKGIRGIIIYAEPTAQNHNLLLTAVKRGIHIVQIDRYMPDLPCDYVGVDNQTAANDMVKHLLKSGHKRIAFLSINPEPSTCRERLAGYQKALHDHCRLGFDDSLVQYLDVHKNLKTELERSVKYWLNLPEPPTAIFAVNDDLALLVIQALRFNNRKVPNDIAVVGFDNLRAASFVSPSLTTIQQPFVDLGATAAQLLLNRMTGSYEGEPKHILLSTKLVVRESCTKELERVLVPT